MIIFFIAVFYIFQIHLILTKALLLSLRKYTYYP